MSKKSRRKNRARIRAAQMQQNHTQQIQTPQEETPMTNEMNQAIAPIGITEERVTEQTVELLPVDKLKLGEYQRNTDLKRAKLIATNFDVAKLGLLVVSNRSGIYYLLDGAHRASALRLLNYSHTRCIVLHGLTYQQEADYFRTQRDNTRSLTQYSLFKAGVEAEDPLCIAIQEIAEKHGFEIRATSKNFKFLSAIHALRTVATVYGNDVLDTTLRLIRETWDGLKETTKREYIVGVAEFVSRFGEANFAKIMCKKSLTAIWQDYMKFTTYASRASNDPAMRKAFCMALLAQYNQRLVAHNRLYMED
jgi:hypothetical protein